MIPQRVGIIGFDGVETLDLLAPFEILAATRIEGKPAYDVHIIGLTGRDFRSESGLLLKADVILEDALACDLLIIPGGTGLREPANLTLAAEFLSARSQDFRRIASVCTGIYALAEAGLLDGRRATTHWRFADQFRFKYPDVNLDAGAVVTRDGKFYSSAGVVTGMELVLALILEDHGPVAALAAAREFVTTIRDRETHACFADEAQFEAAFGDRLASLAL